MPSNAEIIITVRDQATGQLRQIKAELAGLGTSASQSATQFGLLDKAVSGVGKNFASDLRLAGTAATLAIGGIGAAVVKTGVEFNAMKEQATIAFTTMLGDAKKAKDFIEELQAFAARTPFEFEDLVRGTQKLMAMGFAAEDVLPTLTAIGDAAAALGLSGAEGIGRLTLALGQMQAKGKVSGEEMRQLAEAGIPAWDMLAKKIGVSIPEAMKLSEQGAISAATGISALVEGMNARFGGMMEAQSHTIAGLWSTLKDTFAIGAGAILEPFMEDLRKGMIDLTATMSDPKFAQSVSGVVKDIVGPIKDAGDGWLDFVKIVTGNKEVLIGAAVAIGAAFAWAHPLLAAIIGIGLALHELDDIKITTPSGDKKSLLEEITDLFGLGGSEAASRAHKDVFKWVGDGAKEAAREAPGLMLDAFDTALDNSADGWKDSFKRLFGGSTEAAKEAGQGAADAMAEGFSDVDFGDAIAESFGEVTRESASATSSWASDMLDFQGVASGAAEGIAEAMGTAFDDAGSDVLAFATGSSTAVDQWARAVESAVSLAASAIGGAADDAKTDWAQATSEAAESIRGLIPVAQEVATAAADALAGGATSFADAWEIAIGGAEANLRGLEPVAKEVATGVAQALAGAFADLPGEVAQAVSSAIGSLNDLLAAAQSTATGIATAIGGANAAQPPPMGGTASGSTPGSRCPVGYVWDDIGQECVTPQEMALRTALRQPGMAFGPPLASGMSFVPSDNFRAVLHRGERVLTAEENRDYSAGGGIIINIDKLEMGGRIDDANSAIETMGYALAANAKSRGIII